MEIHYDVVNKGAAGREVLTGSFDTIQAAHRSLAEQRHDFPNAYLEKSIVTRCRETAK